MDTAAFVGLILALIFLFSGEPDVWDKLRDRVMRDVSCEAQQ